MNIRNLILFSIFYSLFSLFCYSVEIPIEGSSGGAVSIACVDMEKLFKEYPKVEQSKKEYETLKKEKQTELEEKEIEIKNIQEEIKNIEKEIENIKESIHKISESEIVQPIEISTAPVEILISTDTEILISTETFSETITTSTFTVSKTTDIATLEIQLQEKKNIIEEKNKEYKELEEKIKKELKEFETSKTMAIMADLYKIIKELAEEENISIVVEKQNILYGLPNTDITDKVIDRLRGKQ